MDILMHILLSNFNNFGIGTNYCTQYKRINCLVPMKIISNFIILWNVELVN